MLQIDRVETEMEVMPSAANGTLPGREFLAGKAGTSADLRECLRPIVLEILNEELERLRRRQG